MEALLTVSVGYFVKTVSVPRRARAHRNLHWECGCCAPTETRVCPQFGDHRGLLVGVNPKPMTLLALSTGGAENTWSHLRIHDSKLPQHMNSAIAPAWFDP